MSETSRAPYRFGNDPSLEELTTALATALTPLGFRSRPFPDEQVLMRGLWVRKTFNTNRGVVLLEPPREASSCARVGALTQSLKLSVGKAAGYFHFFYPVGLQFIWFGPCSLTDEAALAASVDTFDNQRAIAQSIFVFDTQTRRHVGTRTWGQVVTGKFQDAIDAALRKFGASGGS